jgi:hypothetical protein
LQGSLFRKMVKLIMNIGDNELNQSPQECVGKTGVTDDNQAGKNPPEVAVTSPPIRKQSDDADWKFVVPKGRRLITDMMIKREEKDASHFLAQNKFVKV